MVCFRLTNLFHKLLTLKSSDTRLLYLFFPNLTVYYIISYIYSKYWCDKAFVAKQFWSIYGIDFFGFYILFS